RNPLVPSVWALNTFNAAATRNQFDTYDVVGELNSSFLDKRLLLDIRAGYHYQKDQAQAADGSGYNDVNNPSVLAGIRFGRGSANTNLLVYEDQVPAAVKQACSVPTTGTTLGRCNVAFGFGGTSGLLLSNKQDAVQARATLTYLLTAVGHHVFKGGIDEQSESYTNTFTYSGGVAYGNAGGQTLWFDSRRFG